MSVRGEVVWWSRWWVRYFPGHAVARLRHCRRSHRGPFLDGIACMTCGGPWFRGSL